MNLFRTVAWVIIINCFLSCQHSGNDYSESKKVEINVPKKVEELENLTVISDQKAPLFDISFKKVGTFGSTENILFYYVGNFSVDNENRVYIADKNDIKVFQADGAFIKTLGRKGRGPGEFNNFGALSP
ncbi:MAG: 6-bladed beta-propeller, partial [Candidatus Paceibacterota bacterium]